MASKPLRQADKENFQTLLQAAANGGLALISTTRNSDGKQVALVCAMSYENGAYYPAPLAVMVEGNPYEDFEDPTDPDPSDLHGLSDVPDTHDRTLWDAIAAVATEAPSAQARIYAEQARDAVVEGGSEGLRVQVVYILSNLSTWRGERAKAVKAILKKYAKR